MKGELTMSILIKGMEMPESCYKCPFLDYEEGFCFASGVKNKGGWYESTLCPADIKDGRHDDCPLVEVETPHGRLIDADEMLRWMRDYYAEKGFDDRELHFSLLDMEMNFQAPLPWNYIEEEEGDDG